MGALLVGPSLLLLLIFSLPVVADALVRPLENHYPVWSGEPIEAVQAIVILGSGAWGGAPTDPAADLRARASARMAGGVQLARTHPDLPVLVGGMTSASEMRAWGEAVGGIPGERFILLDESKTTEEEAQDAANEIAERSVFLVTSAMHLPRAVVEFEAAGFAVIPVPVDFRQSGSKGFALFQFIPHGDAWGKTQDAIHEYLGLAAADLFRGSTD